MAFKLLDQADAMMAPLQMLSVADEPTACVGEVVARRVKRGQFQALRCDDGTWLVEIAPGKLAPDGGAGQVPAHIANLCSQIEALNQQLGEQSTTATGMVSLLRQMIEARERELDAWLAREEGWERRLTAIEGAIRERDEFRRREAALLQERDEARRKAATAEAQLDRMERAVDAARRDVEAAQAFAEKANAEQLRLRAEREVDRSVWVRERRQLTARIEQLADRGWLTRFVRGKS